MSEELRDYALSRHGSFGHHERWSYMNQLDAANHAFDRERLAGHWVGLVLTGARPDATRVIVREWWRNADVKAYYERNAL